MNKMLKVILVILLTSGVAIASCSSGTTPELADGEETLTYQLEINLLGKKNEFFVDSQGRLKSKVAISSADGRVSLSADKGTTFLDKDGKPLHSIYAVVDSSPSLPPEDACIVGTAYNLAPQGATFEPRLLLTLSYDPEELPEGLREKDLYIAYHNGTEWCKLLYKRVDTDVHSVTTQVYHFTTFAILGPKGLAPSVPTTTQGTEVGNLAPSFQLQNLSGQSVALSNFRGKPVLVNFWATWCLPCRSEMPYIQEIYDAWSDKGLVVLAINIGEGASNVEEFRQHYGISFPVLLDTKKDVARRYNIRAIPTTFFIDKDGIIRVKIIGAFPSKAAIEKQLSEIIP